MSANTLVVLPIHNGAQFLQEALESIEKQTVPVRVAIINDASTDSTMEIVESFKTRLDITTYENKRKMGIGFCSNLALSYDLPDYYFNFSYDDILMPEYVETAVKFLEANQQLDIFVPAMQVFGQENHVWQAEGLNPGIKTHNTCFFSSIVRFSLWKKLRGYAIDMPYSGWEDWEFWSRAFDAGAKSLTWQTPLMKYRTHANNLSKENALKINELLNWMRTNKRIV